MRAKEDALAVATATARRHDEDASRTLTARDDALRRLARAEAKAEELAETTARLKSAAATAAAAATTRDAETAANRAVEVDALRREIDRLKRSLT